jgi:uncharacterized protein
MEIVQNPYLCLIVTAAISLLLLFPKSMLPIQSKAILLVTLIFFLWSEKFITLIGLGLLCIAGMAMYASTATRIPLVARIISGLIATIFIFGFSLKALPGFEQTQIAAPQFLGTSTVPFRINISFAKCVMGLLVLFFWVKPEENWSDIGKKIMSALPFVICIPVAVITLAHLLGYKIDIKWYDFSAYFILGNFCLSTLTEEAFFRATLQERFGTFISKYSSHAGAISLISVSIFFGALHLGGGTLYAFLALVAGLGYGWVYWRYQSLHAAIITHLLLNSLHFTLLVYPG